MESITFPASLDQLATINKYIKDRLPEDFLVLADRVTLAVEELLVNICHYAYGDQGGQAELNCWMVNFDGQPHFRLLLRDWGPAYDPFLEAPAPELTSSLADRPIGGLGLHLVKNMVSHYCYSYTQSANSIDLFFARPRPAPES